MTHILLEDVESITVKDDWLYIRTIKGDIYRAQGIISFTRDSLHGNLEQIT